MASLLEKITGSPERNSLESRLYNALTFFTPFAALFVIPIAFMLKLSLYHIGSVLIICAAGFYSYYLSRIKKRKSNLFVILTGTVLLSVIWITGYGSVGYVFLFFQFVLIFSLLVLKNGPRLFFFCFLPVVVILLLGAEYYGLTVPMSYPTAEKRVADFAINFLVWFFFTGLIIKVIVDNFRAERALLDEDLAVAQKLQHRLLPRHVPRVPGYTLHFCYIPMEKVGGDFYDCNVTEEQIELMIADVSGHGLPGAFLAAVTKMAFDYERGEGPLPVVLERTNRAVLASTVNSNFVTVFACSIDRKTSLMHCSSAGHLPVIVLGKNKREIRFIKPKGKPLGWFDDPGIEEEQVQLEPGDRLILYTDGITECRNSKGKIFGSGAFKDFIIRNSGLSAGLFCRNLIECLSSYSGAEFFDDDITIIVLDVEERIEEGATFTEPSPS